MKDNYIKDLKEIKEIMNRTARFISLSGLSGISTGITALLGALFAYEIIYKHEEFLTYNAVDMSDENLWYLLLTAIGTLLISIVSAIFFTTRKTKRQNLSVWDIQTKRLLISLIIPLMTGGILSLMFLFKGFVGILPSLTLIFYGLALVNGSKYTLPEIRNLGIIQILLGLMAFHFISYSILFWAFGFGIIQIIYGLIIQKKYKEE